MGRRPLPKRISPFIIKPLTSMITWGISSPFELLSPSSGQVTNALLTRSPLRAIYRSTYSPFDLHVLGTPPAFILSQDQTLRIILFCIFRCVMFIHFTLWNSTGSSLSSYHSSIVKVHRQLLILAATPM